MAATALFTIAKEAGLRWADDACYRLAASLAYYALFSLFPLLLIAVSLLGAITHGDVTSRRTIVGWIGASSSNDVRAVVDATLASLELHQTARGVSEVIGVVTLVFGASAVFSELESALDTIWRSPPRVERTAWQTLLQAARDKAFAALVALLAAAGVFVTLAASTALSVIGRAAGASSSIPWLALETLASLTVMTLLFAALFRVVPRRPIAWRDVLGGAFVAALLLTGLKRLLAWYLSHVASYAAYGAVGAVLALLSWIYVASLLLFYGAEFAAAYERRKEPCTRAPPNAPSRRQPRGGHRARGWLARATAAAHEHPPR